VKNVVVDAGFLVALWRREDQHHAWAVTAAQTHPPVWTTCEAVFSEAEHLLGPPGRASLRTASRRGALRLAPIFAEETGAVLDLLDKYEDVPMSLADACIVRLTEVLSDVLVLTTDTDFKVYRRHSRRVVPCLLP
jgi:predicted nucleic acid-binding protein